MTAKKDPVVVTPLPVPESTAGEPLPSAPPAPTAPKKFTPMQKAMMKCDEIDVMVGYSTPEVRDTVRSITAQIRDLLS